MTHAHELLERVQAAGGKLSVSGADLAVEAPSPLPAELVEALRAAKPDLIEHLRGDGWDATDWWALYQERVAIAEHDGGLPTIEAGRQAFEDCIAFWLCRNPPPEGGPETCAQCRQPHGRVGDDAIPVLTGDGGHLWLHHGCHAVWIARRRTEAAKALAEVEIKKPE